MAKCNCNSYNTVKTIEQNISLYKCIFRREYETSFGINDKPEHWSNLRAWNDPYPCPLHEVNFDDDETPTFAMTEIQNSCNGHMLKNSQDIAVDYEFPIIKTGKPVKPFEYNTILKLLQQQITLRKKHKKYENMPDLSSSYYAPHASIENRISAPLELTNLLTAIRNLQPANNHDNYPTQTPALTPNNENPLVSKLNMQEIVAVIKNDIKDCICYSDCNGYSVCWCYGNCNHY